MRMDLNKVTAAILLLLFLLAGAAVGQGLKIDRATRTVPFFRPLDGALPGWRKVGKDLYRGSYTVPPTFVEYSESGEVIGKSARTIMEEAGVDFGKSGKVEYSPELSKLTLLLSRDMMELADAYVGGCTLGSGQNYKIPVHVEIFELPTFQALELIESCMVEGDHSPERNAALKLVKQKHARLIAMPTIVTRSGQRGEIRDGDEVFYPTEIYSDNKENEDKGILLDTRLVGTIFEVEPILEPDGETIALSIELEHHSAPPVMKPLTNRTQVSQFHSNKITSHIQLRKGGYVLLGSWKPTGKPE